MKRWVHKDFEQSKKICRDCQKIGKRRKLIGVRVVVLFCAGSYNSKENKEKKKKKYGVTWVRVKNKSNQ